MSEPASNATPDLFKADIAPLLSGQTSWADLWPVATAWLVSSGLTIVLVIAIAMIAARAYQAGVNRLFRVINGNLRPGAIARARGAARWAE